jgi:hypothetical protein
MPYEITTGNIFKKVFRKTARNLSVVGILPRLYHRPLHGLVNQARQRSGGNQATVISP